jgi:hypothetical protein
MKTAYWNRSRQLLRFRVTVSDFRASSPPPNLTLPNTGSLSIVAGADTTSSALTSFFYLVMRHPEAYSLLQQEVDSLGDDFTNPDKQTKLPYLNAAM